MFAYYILTFPRDYSIRSTDDRKNVFPSFLLIKEVSDGDLSGAIQLLFSSDTIAPYELGKFTRETSRNPTNVLNNEKFSLSHKVLELLKKHIGVYSVLLNRRGIQILFLMTSRLKQLPSHIDYYLLKNCMAISKLMYTLQSNPRRCCSQKLE